MNDFSKLLQPTQSEIELDYRIVIPSKGRSKNMPKCLDMFPTALIYIDIEELEDYLEYVPRHKILLHPPTNKLSVLRNYLLDILPNETFFTVDDDINYVISLVGRRTRKITDPKSMIQIIENAVIMLKDADLNLFIWASSANPMTFMAGEHLKYVGLPSGAYVLRGKDYRYDENLFVRLDLDLVMHQLLENRIVLSDTRFYWQDKDGYQGGTGGCQALRSKEMEKFEKEYLYGKWGSHLYLDKEKSNGLLGVSIKVKRRL